MTPDVAREWASKLRRVFALMTTGSPQSLTAQDCHALAVLLDTWADEDDLKRCAQCGLLLSRTSAPDGLCWGCYTARAEEEVCHG